MTMDDLIEKTRAAIDAEATAIDAYHQHREHGPHINHPGQNPDDYDEYDSCSTCIATAQSVRFHRPDTGRGMIEAHRKIIDLHEIEYIKPTLDSRGHMMFPHGGWYCSVCSERPEGERIPADGIACPTVLALADAYGVDHG